MQQVASRWTPFARHHSPDSRHSWGSVPMFSFERAASCCTEVDRRKTPQCAPSKTFQFNGAVGGAMPAETVTSLLTCADDGKWYFTIGQNSLWVCLNSSHCFSMVFHVFSRNFTYVQHQSTFSAAVLHSLNITPEDYLWSFDDRHLESGGHRNLMTLSE